MYHSHPQVLALAALLALAGVCCLARARLRRVGLLLARAGVALGTTALVLAVGASMATAPASAAGCGGSSISGVGGISIAVPGVCPPQIKLPSPQIKLSSPQPTSQPQLKLPVKLPTVSPQLKLPLQLPAPQFTLPLQLPAKAKVQTKQQATASTQTNVPATKQIKLSTQVNLPATKQVKLPSPRLNLPTQLNLPVKKQTKLPKLSVPTTTLKLPALKLPALKLPKVKSPSGPQLKLPTYTTTGSKATSPAVCPMITGTLATSCPSLPGQNPKRPTTQPACYLTTADPAEVQAQYQTLAAGNAMASTAGRLASVLARNAGKPLTAAQVADLIKAGTLTPADIASMLAQPQAATYPNCSAKSTNNKNNDVAAAKKGKGGNAGDSGKGRLSKSYRQIADAFNATVADVKDAIHAAKRYGYFGGARSNPDVVIDLDTGEIYVDLGNGQVSGDSIGNIKDYLP